MPGKKADAEGFASRGAQVIATGGRPRNCGTVGPSWVISRFGKLGQKEVPDMAVNLKIVKGTYRSRAAGGSL